MVNLLHDCNGFLSVKYCHRDLVLPARKKQRGLDVATKRLILLLVYVKINDKENNGEKLFVSRQGCVDEVLHSQH